MRLKTLRLYVLCRVSMPSIQRNLTCPQIWAFLASSATQVLSWQLKKVREAANTVSSPLGNVELQSHKLTRFSPRLEVTEGAVFCHPAKLIARPARLNQFCSDSAGLTHPPSCKVAPRMCWAQSTQATLLHMQINLLT
jgi:hypothetical protein